MKPNGFKPSIVKLEALMDLPRLYSQDGKGDDAIALIKFFTPDSNWTWFITEADAIVQHKRGLDEEYIAISAYHPNEYDLVDVIMFGLVQGHETELGYVSLRELDEARGPFGLNIERDMYWTPTTLGDIRKELV